MVLSTFFTLKMPDTQKCQIYRLNNYRYLRAAQIETNWNLDLFNMYTLHIEALKFKWNLQCHSLHWIQWVKVPVWALTMYWEDSKEKWHKGRLTEAFKVSLATTFFFTPISSNAHAIPPLKSPVYPFHTYLFPLYYSSSTRSTAPVCETPSIRPTEDWCPILYN